MTLQKEFPSDYTRIACPNEDCTWCGDITDLVVMEDSDCSLVCICPVCAETIFEQYDPLVHLPVKPNGDATSEIQDQRHSPQPVS